MAPKSAQTNVVVVGDGMAGLTTACYLVRAGVKVILLEKTTTLGGRAFTQRFDDFRFNRGIHALYTDGEASQILQELGAKYSYGVPAKETFVLQGGELRPFPSNLLGLLRTDLLDAGDKVAPCACSPSLPRSNRMP
jgi:phytoene dehydrogenase-like protein